MTAENLTTNDSLISPPINIEKKISPPINIEKKTSPPEYRYPPINIEKNIELLNELKAHMKILSIMMDTNEFSEFQAKAVQQMMNYRKLLIEHGIDGDLLDSLTVAYANNLNNGKS